VCAYHCTQLLYNTAQNRTVLIIFPPNLQTIIIALMMSVGGEEEKLWAGVQTHLYQFTVANLPPVE